MPATLNPYPILFSQQHLNGLGVHLFKHFSSTPFKTLYAYVSTFTVYLLNIMNNTHIYIPVILNHSALPAR